MSSFEVGAVAAEFVAEFTKATVRAEDLPIAIAMNYVTFTKHLV